MATIHGGDGGSISGETVRLKNGAVRERAKVDAVFDAIRSVLALGDRGDLALHDLHTISHDYPVDAAPVSQTSHDILCDAGLLRRVGKGYWPPAPVTDVVKSSIGVKVLTDPETPVYRPPANGQPLSLDVYDQGARLYELSRPYELAVKEDQTKDVWATPRNIGGDCGGWVARQRAESGRTR